MITRRLISTAAAIALLSVLAAAPASAQGLAGTWMFDVDISAGTGQAGFVFEVDGTTLTGTYTGILGEHAIVGTVEGNSFEFAFESADAGEVHFRGTIDGDTVEGSCEYGQLGAGGFEGARTG